MESIIERQAHSGSKKLDNPMLNIEFIGKSVIGILGTTLSIMTEHVSGILSIVAGLLTIWYMATQLINAKRRGQREEVIFDQKQEKFNSDNQENE